MKNQIHLFIFCALTVCASIAHAENILTSEGIAGDVDKNRRGPTLSVGTPVTDGVAQILADVSEPNSEFQKYPIKIEFFVNRELLSTQYRSPTLPGPIGITVPTSTAIPFNYTVVATLLHPNRLYTTVIEGAVFASQLDATLTCSLTIETSSSTGDTESEQTTDTILYVAEGVTTNQSANNSFALSFDAESEDGSSSVKVSGTFEASEGSDGTGSLSVTDEEEQVTTSSGTTTIELTDGELSSLKFTSEDGNTELSCS